MGPVNQPGIKAFNYETYCDLINGLTEQMEGKDSEKACTGIVQDILTSY
jgi:hypothetical protein